MKVIVARGVALEPAILSRFQQSMRANDISFNKRVRTGNRAVDMTLCGKVNQRVNCVIVKYCFDQRLIGNGSFDKGEPGSAQRAL